MIPMLTPGVLATNPSPARPTLDSHHVPAAAGCWGRHVVARLREHGATQSAAVERDRYGPSTPRRQTLRQFADIRRVLNACKSDRVIHLGDPARLIASSERIQQALGWKPKYPTLEMLVETTGPWRIRHQRI